MESTDSAGAPVITTSGVSREQHFCTNLLETGSPAGLPFPGGVPRPAAFQICRKTRDSEVRTEGLMYCAFVAFLNHYPGCQIFLFLASLCHLKRAHVLL